MLESHLTSCSSNHSFISQKLNQFTRAPEYIAYLAYILSSLTQEEDRIRTIAGYLLKNNSRLILGSPPEVADYVKSAVLQAFNDSSIMIRNAASQDIVAFLGVLEPRNWPECLQQLVNTLDSTDLDRQEVRSHFIMMLWPQGGGLQSVSRVVANEPTMVSTPIRKQPFRAFRFLAFLVRGF